MYFCTTGFSFESCPIFQNNHDSTFREISILCENLPYAPAASSFHEIFSLVLDKESVRKHFLILALDNSRLAGFLEADAIFETVDLNFIGVNQEFQRKGVAHSLVQLLLKISLEIAAERVVLEVGRENQGALALYRKTGFREIGLRHCYYNGVEDALIMERFI